KVGGFEDEMAQFFERLLAEDDPTHFATMAENLPEPPAFDEMAELDPVEFAAQIEYEAAIAEPVASDQVTTDGESTEAEAVATDETVEGEAEVVATGEAVEGEAEVEAELQVGEADTETQAQAAEAGT